MRKQFCNLIQSVLIILLSVLSMTSINLAQMEHTDSIIVVKWNIEDNLIATGRINGEIDIWDTITETLITTLGGHSGAIINLAWSPDGSKIASGSIDQTVKIWDVEHRTLLTTLVGHTDWVGAVLWSLDGTKVYSGGIDENPNLRVWDIATGKNIASEDTGSIIDLMWNPDNTILTVVNPLGSIALLDPQTLQPTGIKFIEHPSGSLDTVAWDSNGEIIAGSSADGSIAIWDVKTGEQLAILGGNNNANIDYFSTTIRSIIFVEESNELLSAAADGTLTLWSITEQTTLKTFKVTHPIRAARWNSTGDKLAYGEYLTTPNGESTLSSNTDDGIKLEITQFPSTLSPK